jgi:hypothetical protein
MNPPFDRARSLEELEAQRRPEPPADATYLVRAVHALRKRPVGELTVEELARLIGQYVGLAWLLPMAVELLRSEAVEGAGGGWCDDDLLTAVITRGGSVWVGSPELALLVAEDVLDVLGDALSPCLREDAARFRAALP